MFSLQTTETIYDDFGCSLAKSTILKGRMYLTESFVCFSEQFLGIGDKLKIDLAQVKEIMMEKIAGFDNAITILNGDDSKISFVKFEIKTEEAYEAIRAMWMTKQDDGSADAQSQEDQSEKSDEEKITAPTAEQTPPRADEDSFELNNL